MAIDVLRDGTYNGLPATVGSDLQVSLFLFSLSLSLSSFFIFLLFPTSLSCFVSFYFLSFEY